MGDVEPAPHSGGSATVAPEVPSKLVGPVVAPDKKDKDDWKDVAKKVADKKILFEPMAAISAAGECQTAIGGILGLQKAITDMGQLKRVSHLQSGSLLAVQFNETLRGLNRVLETHKQGLNTMLDTFKAAAKKFIDAELDSASGFDRATAQQYRDTIDAIKAPTTASKLSAIPKDSKMPKVENMSDDDDPAEIFNRNYLKQNLPKDQEQYIDNGDIAKAKPSDLVKPAAISQDMMGGNTQSQPQALEKASLETGPTPENPDSQQWHDLYRLGQSTGEQVKNVHHAGTMWDWMSKELDRTVGTFTTNLMNTHGWSGPSAKSAQDAVKRYHAKAAGLSERMKGVGANLKYTSEWLANTKKGMPTSPYPAKQTTTAYHDEYVNSFTVNPDSYTAAQNSRDLAIYRQNMENNYVQGIQTSSNYVPALDELPTTSPKKTDPTDKPASTKTDPAAPNPGRLGPSAPSPGPTAPYSPITPPQVPQATDYNTPPLVDPADQPTPTSPASADLSDLTQSPTAPSGLDGLSQATDLAQQGMGGVENAMQAATQAAQQAAGAGLNAARAGLPNLPGGLGTSGIGAGPGKLGGGAGLSGSAATSALQKEADAARLFPRASAAGPASALGRPNAVPGAGVATSGSPGSPGAAGSQGQGQNREHKRPKYLNSTKPLEELLGDAPTVTKAVVEK